MANTTYDLFEVVRKGGEVYTEYNNRLDAKEKAQECANEEGVSFDVVRKTVSTTKVIIARFVPKP